eukprot:Colp12_sorted_trinity150504_noHs@31630
MATAHKPAYYSQNARAMEGYTHSEFDEATTSQFESYKFRYNALAGAVALPLSFALMHPVDTVKTRMQAMLPSTIAEKSFYAQLRSSIRSAGPSMLSRGFFMSVAGAIPQGGLRLGSYGEAQKALHPHFDSPVLRNACAACIGDVASSIAKVPREIIVQRLQTGMYASTGEAIRTILKKEGLRGFFTGYWSTTLRDIPFMVVLFTSYEQFKIKKIR